MNIDRIRELAGLPALPPVAVIVEATEVAEEVVAEVAEVTEVVAEEVVIEAAAEKIEKPEDAPPLDPEKAVGGAKVPKEVAAAIATRITELKASIEVNNEKGYNDGGVKQNAIDALEKIRDNLATEDGLTKANIFYGTLMSPITDLLPPKVVKFLHSCD